MSMENDEKKQLLKRFGEFKSKTRPQNSNNVKEDVLNSARTLFKGRKWVFKSFQNGIFLKCEESKQAASRLKMLTPKQMLQRLLIALVYIQAGNNSESLLNKIRQNAYPLYQSKEITKKIYKNIIKLMKVQ